MATAADLATLGTDGIAITDALVERWLSFGIRIRPEGPHPSRETLTTIADSADKIAKAAALLEAGERRHAKRVCYTDRQRGITDHASRKEAAALAKTMGQDPRNAASEWGAELNADTSRATL